jgi:sporulation protein YlmC with PRC-barrel domain
LKLDKGRIYFFDYRKVFKLIAIFFNMLKVKKVTEVIGKKVYTDTGDYFGEIEESNLIENKIDSWRIRIASSMGSFLGGARGVIIPHRFVKAVGDVIIVSRASLPLEEGEDVVEQTVDLSEAGSA